MHLRVLSLGFVSLNRWSFHQTCHRCSNVALGRGRNRIDERQKWRFIEEKWSGRRDLNSRPLAPQASALAGLRYAPNHRPTCGRAAHILAGAWRVSITNSCQSRRRPADFLASLHFQFSRNRKCFAGFVASTPTVFRPLVARTGREELVHAPAAAPSVSCKTNPVDGAGQDSFTWLSTTRA